MHRTLLKAIQKTSNSPLCGSDNPFSASTQKPVHQESIRSSSRKQYQRIIPEIFRRGSSFIPSCTVLYRSQRRSRRKHAAMPAQRAAYAGRATAVQRAGFPPLGTVSLFGVDGRKNRGILNQKAVKEAA